MNFEKISWLKTEVFDAKEGDMKIKFANSKANKSVLTKIKWGTAFWIFQSSNSKSKSNNFLGETSNPFAIASKVEIVIFCSAFMAR